MLTATLHSRSPSGFTLDVQLRVPAGITMVFGESGSGKTTLLKCISGLRRPDAGLVSVGDVTWFDRDRGIDLPTQHRRLGYVFQDLALFPHMTVEGNLHYGLPHLSRDERQARTAAIAESFRIGHLLRRRPGDISGGERQRTALARSLVTDPRLLLLDEPLSSLDHVTQSRIIEDLRTWNAARGIPILYVSHSHREVFALGEHLLVMDRGRIIAEGSPADVLQAPERESLAQLAGFENFLDATVVQRDAAAGTMHCRLQGSGVELEAPLGAAKPGTDIRLAVRAGDILLATEAPRGLSARNVLPGTIRSIQREGATVIVMVEAGARFEVHLTPGALTSLALAPGTPVWLIIKTHSCRVVASVSGT